MPEWRVLNSVSSYRTRLEQTLSDRLNPDFHIYILEEAKVIIESWRRHYNTVRPHSSLGYRLPNWRPNQR